MSLKKYTEIRGQIVAIVTEEISVRTFREGNYRRID